MKTVDRILAEIHEHRPMSRAMLYNRLKSLGITPAGARQRPQRYPDDTALRILSHLGFATGNARLMSTNELKRERKARRS